MSELSSRQVYFRRRTCQATGVFVAVFGLALAHAQDKPLPDLESFLRDVRKTLRSDRVLLSQYTYVEKNTENRLDKQGRVTKTEVEVREVYPSIEEDLSYERLVSKNGTPVDAKELQKKDLEQQNKVLEWTRKVERETPADKAKRLAKAADERRKEDEAIDEAFRLYSFSMKGREVVDGRDAIVIGFRPRPDFNVKTDGGKILKKVAGRGWVDERDHEVVRIEAELIDTISIGLGMLAKLNKGARAMFRRRLINGEIWLPAEAHFTGSARVLLLKGMRIDAKNEYSDYKKFSVETTSSFSGPKPSP
jgi:hypothetical protein